ncbi:putative methyltransferase [Stipitochalara longipes BDJ]|nr:putative methyltransferase [Stipitochalara longipes BDJ]
MENLHLSSTYQKHLRATFTENAELYDRIRPRCPPALFNDLETLARLGPQSRVLEIGPGTGQATLPLAQLGCSVLAVELGAEMAVVARRNLSSFPNVEIAISTFEDWPLPEQKFDLVVSANAFHWIDKKVRMSKAADALREGQGVLAIISTHHIKAGTEAFFDEVQRLYEEHGLAPAPGLFLPAAQDIPKDASDFEREKRFREVEFRRYKWDQSYSTSEYLDLLSTYSNHHILSPDAKERFLKEVAKLIDNKFQGRITKGYMVQLAIAHRL